MDREVRLSYPPELEVEIVEWILFERQNEVPLNIRVNEKISKNFRIFLKSLGILKFQENPKKKSENSLGPKNQFYKIYPLF